MRKYGIWAAGWLAAVLMVAAGVGRAQATQTASATIDDVSIELESISVGRVSFQDGPGKSDETVFAIRFRITNNSETRKIDYRSWRGGGVDSADRTARLVDELGNKYSGVRWPFVPAGGVDRAAIYPGKSISDVCCFEIPVDKARELRLFLTGRNVGLAGKSAELVIRR